MSWIKTQFMKFFGGVQNPYYKKLKRILDYQKVIHVYDKIYFLGGFEYSEDIYSKFIESMNEGKMKQFLDSVKYNTQKDNVELYLIEDNESSYLLTLLDPLELLSGEQVLDIIKSPRINIDDASYEQIYPKAVR
jgi:hypothetical protein